MRIFNVLIGMCLLGLYSLSASAGAGAHGGDIECENAIRTYYVQTIQKWIVSGGPEQARLNLSSTVFPGTNQPYTIAQFEAGMESVIPVDQAGHVDNSRLHISCVSPDDPEWPVDVSDAAKTCTSEQRQDGFHIKCKASKFVAIDQIKAVTAQSTNSNQERALNADEAIEQIFHEFATFVPGLEPDSDDISTYQISDQLSDHVQFIEIPMLVVGSAGCSNGNCPTADPLKPYRDQFDHGQPYNPKAELGSERTLFVNANEAFSGDFIDPIYTDWAFQIGFDSTDFVTHVDIGEWATPQGWTTFGPDPNKDAKSCRRNHTLKGCRMYSRDKMREDIRKAPVLQAESGEYRVYDSYTNKNNVVAPLRYTLRKNGNYIIVKVEVCDDAGNWSESKYDFIKISRDLITDFN